MTLQIGGPLEAAHEERRVATVPDVVEKLIKLGFSVAVQSGAGTGANFSDDDYRTADADVVPKAADLWGRSDIVLTVRPPSRCGRRMDDHRQCDSERTVVDRGACRVLLGADCRQSAQESGVERIVPVEDGRMGVRAAFPVRLFPELDALAFASACEMVAVLVLRLRMLWFGWQLLRRASKVVAASPVAVG
ncbi:NAD/NADP transhydrogenase alpha subunit-like protein [Burkholderia lata]|uniref:proton-translocating NAD(P)(+) transhydrogenase n=1 Tax=Burkholderia lata (strain ATCC 17760 / DSM 23089 / LMG 22485 / NCIMB 9086 / R18194 / 383) TaxID=482957 RepID=Q39LR8_BURL3|nr:NAD/NADP transhydrogenase alpha subunit-like protein [Burkholderia lata]